MKRIALLSTGIMLLSGNVSAADINQVTFGNDMQAALQEEAMNQSAFDAAYCQISQDAYLDISQQSVVQKNNLLAALQATIDQQTSYGNAKVVASLKKIAAYVNAAATTFAEDYRQQIPTTSADASADAAALQALQQNLSSDLSTAGQLTDQLAQARAAQQTATISYINANSAGFLAMAGQLPDVPDGTVATIFATDAAHGCYYINAGEYSGASTGTAYAIMDAAGQYIGNLQLIRTAATYSAGILVSSQNIPLHAKIPALLTKQIPPDSAGQ
ncbi:MAG: hypothetical protein ABFD79_00225 [Phycisphaerales bacterium]